MEKYRKMPLNYPDLHSLSAIKSSVSMVNVLIIRTRKPEDQWSCKRSPDYLPGINTTVKREKGANLIF